MLVSPADLVAVAKATITECSVTEVEQCLNSDTLLIDIREPAEYQKAHIPGAVHLPRGIARIRDPQAGRCRQIQPEPGQCRPANCPLLWHRGPIRAGGTVPGVHGIQKGELHGGRPRCLGGRPFATRISGLMAARFESQFTGILCSALFALSALCCGCGPV